MASRLAAALLVMSGCGGDAFGPSVADAAGGDADSGPALEASAADTYVAPAIESGPPDAPACDVVITPPIARAFCAGYGQPVPPCGYWHADCAGNPVPGPGPEAATVLCACEAGACVANYCR